MGIRRLHLVLKRLAAPSRCPNLLKDDPVIVVPGLFPVNPRLYLLSMLLAVALADYALHCGGGRAMYRRASAAWQQFSSLIFGCGAGTLARAVTDEIAIGLGMDRVAK